MKRLLGLVGVVGALVTVASAQGPGSGQVPWPDVNLTTRDYTGNIQATDRYHHPLPHPAVEKSPTSSVTHVVYVRGSNIQINVIWRNDNDFALTGTLTWQEARLRVPGPNQNPADQFITLNVSGSVAMSLAANGGTQTVPLTITGVPNYVAVGQLEIKYNLPLSKASGQTGNNGTQGNFHGWERIPLIDAAPVGWQSTVWADLCEYSCRWAFGSSEASNVRRELTKGLHWSNRAPWNRTRYGANVGRFYLYNRETWPTTVEFLPFKLKLLLIYLDDPWTQSGPEVSWTDMYCADYAATLQQAMATQGLVADAHFLRPDDLSMFYTWPLCPAGTDSLYDDNYAPYHFGWHMVVTGAGLRYDAAPSYRYMCDVAGTSWKQPAYDWPTSDHWQHPTSLRGLTFGPLQYPPGLPAIMTMTPLTMTPPFVH